MSISKFSLHNKWHFYPVCLLLSLGVWISSCGIIPTKSPTATPIYKHFTPTEYLPFEFDYPSSWEDLNATTSHPYWIGSRDPSLPTPAPGDDDLMRPHFDIFSRQNDEVTGTTQTFTDLEEYVNFWTKYNEGKIEVLIHEKTNLDGVQAFRLVYRDTAVFEFSGKVFEEWIILQDDVIYEIGLQIRETDRNSEFGQQFDEIVRTIKIIR